MTITFPSIKNPTADLTKYGIHTKMAYWNLPTEALMEQTIKEKEGFLVSSGAITVDTGKFTGRSPKDRFIVKDAITADQVSWGAINLPFDSSKFDLLYDKVAAYLSDLDKVYVRDAAVCADENYKLRTRLVAEYPYSAHFVNNMFLRLNDDELEVFEPDWTILCAPGFKADPAVDGTRQGNFAIVNFTRKVLLIGGTGYTGEIKKGIFSVLNFILPTQRNVLTMHCSANQGHAGDAAVFFGLSGTGKTTLSADPDRYLIGDDEHGWSDRGIFNFEGGCYAKAINLTAENEPDIFNAIRHGALLENIKTFEGSRTVNFEDTSITENTRVSYPVDFINNALEPSIGNIPKNVFFLTCDAFGVLPPISNLDASQAMYYFISGYTAKVAGTEVGVVDPEATFSACFGAPFLPLHPTYYAEMLGKKIKENNVNIWLINTGWVGGSYGTGNRIKLRYTRAMITAAMRGELNGVPYTKHEVFGLSMPVMCPNVPDELLNPKKTWSDPDLYDATAFNLAKLFNDNFKQFEDQASPAILSAAPSTTAQV